MPSPSVPSSSRRLSTSSRSIRASNLSNSQPRHGIEKFTISTHGLAPLDTTITYPGIDTLRKGRILFKEPSFTLFKARYTYSNEPNHIRYNVQIRETRLIDAVQTCADGKELKKLYNSKVMDLYALHYLDHDNVMKALWTEPIDPEIGLYVTVIRPFVPIRKLIEKTFETFKKKENRDNNTTYFSFHPNQIMRKDFISLICREVLIALFYLHRRHIFHQNVTADTVYIDHGGNIVLGDFGDAEFVDPKDIVGNEHITDIKGVTLLHAFCFLTETVLTFERENERHVTPVDNFVIYSRIEELNEPLKHNGVMLQSTLKERELWASVLNAENMITAERLLRYELFIPPFPLGYGPVKRAMIARMKEFKILAKPSSEQQGYIERAQMLTKRSQNNTNPIKVEKTVVYGPRPQLEVKAHFCFKSPDGVVFLRCNLAFYNTQEYRILAFLKHLARLRNPFQLDPKYSFESVGFVITPWEILTIRKAIDVCLEELLLGAEVSSTVEKLDVGFVEIGMYVPDPQY